MRLAGGCGHAEMSAEPESVFVGLGANLGDREQALRCAVAALGALPGTQLRQVSSLYRSTPVDAGGPDYLNAVVHLGTTLEPCDLLDALQCIEDAAGRERPFRNAPRTLDLDILLFGDRVLDTLRLTLPHPRLWQRGFVLMPLAELAPGRAAVGGVDIADVAARQGVEPIRSPAWAGLALADLCSNPGAGDPQA